jgi:hypothetical protein
MNVVAKLDSAVHLSVPTASTGAGTLDAWAGEHIIRRIPGAGDGGD